MSALEHVPQQRLAELLMSAVTRLAEPDSTTYSLVPIGVPVRRGRLHLGRLQLMFNTTEPLNVAVGFATAGWIGARGVALPDPRSARLSQCNRRRLTGTCGPRSSGPCLARCGWLGVADPMCFDVVLAPAPNGGLLIVPVDEFARRWQAIS